jgi:hypothetical protein
MPDNADEDNSYLLVYVIIIVVILIVINIFSYMTCSYGLNEGFANLDLPKHPIPSDPFLEVANYKTNSNVVTELSLKIPAIPEHQIINQKFDPNEQPTVLEMKNKPISDISSFFGSVPTIKTPTIVPNPKYQPPTITAPAIPEKIISVDLTKPTITIPSHYGPNPQYNPKEALTIVTVATPATMKLVDHSEKIFGTFFNEPSFENVPAVPAKTIINPNYKPQYIMIQEAVVENPYYTPAVKIADVKPIDAKSVQVSKPNEINNVMNNNIPNNADCNGGSWEECVKANGAGWCSDNCKNKDGTLTSTLYNKNISTPKPVEVKPKEVKPVEVKPKEVKPVEVKPNTVASVDEKDAMRKQIETNNNSVSIQKAMPDNIAEDKNNDVKMDKKEDNIPKIDSNNLFALDVKSDIIPIKDGDVKKLLVDGVFKLRVNLPNVYPYLKTGKPHVLGESPNYFYLCVESLNPNCQIKGLTSECVNIYVDGKDCTNKLQTIENSTNSYRLILVPEEYVKAKVSKVGDNSDFTLLNIDGKMYLKNVQTGYMPSLKKNEFSQKVTGYVDMSLPNTLQTIPSMTNELCGAPVLKQQPQDKNSKTSNFKQLTCNIVPDAIMNLQTTKDIGKSSPIGVIAHKDGTISINLKTFNTYGYENSSYSLISCDYNVNTYKDIEKITSSDISYFVNLVCFDDDSNRKYPTKTLNFDVELTKFPKDFIINTSIFDINK